MLTTSLVSRDAPNAWPPHQYIALQALNAIPANLTSAAIPTPSQGTSTYSLIPPGQVDVPEDSLPAQTIAGSSVNASTTGAQADINLGNGTVSNGGNATQGEGWRDQLGRELANRYFASVLCSWCVDGRFRVSERTRVS
jgi:alpha,alpha-trehalase